MIYLAINFNPIYWNCACLIVNSGALENEPEEMSDEDYDYSGEEYCGVSPEDVMENKPKNKKVASTDYGKIAKAIGDI